MWCVAIPKNATAAAGAAAGAGAAAAVATVALTALIYYVLSHRINSFNKFIYDWC